MKITYTNRQGKEAEWEVVKIKSMQPLPAGSQWVDMELLKNEEVEERIAEGRLRESAEASVVYDIRSIYPVMYFGVFVVNSIPKDTTIEAVAYLKTEWGSVEWRHKDDVFLVNYPIYKQTCQDAGITPESFGNYVQMCKHDAVIFAEIEPV